MKIALALSLALVLPASALEVTVYNSNLGLIKDTRPFTLASGVNSVQVVDVAAQIDPTSVHFKSLTAPDAVTVLEQDFHLDGRVAPGVENLASANCLDFSHG